MERKRRGLTVALLVLVAAAGAFWGLRPPGDAGLEEASLEDLQRMAKERPDSARVHYWLGKRLGPRRKEESFDALARAAELDRDEEEIWIAAAAAANGAHGPEAALGLMNDFLKRHPESRRLRGERSQLLAAIQKAAEGFAGAKRYEQAETYYRQLLSQDPESATLLEGMGRTLLAAGKPEKALPLLEKAVKNDPARTEAQMALARLYQENGFTRQAVERVKALTNAVPTHAPGWHLLGQLISDSDPAGSLQAFENAVKNAPDNALAYLDLAAMAEANHKGNDAEASYRKALSLAPKDATILSRVGGFLASGAKDPKRRAEAEQLLKQAIAANPKAGDAYYHQGRLALERGDAPSAIRLLEVATRRPLDEDPTAVWYALSRAYGAAGNAAKAQATQIRSQQIRAEGFALARAVEEAFRNPRDPAKRLAVARLYVKKEQFVPAISQYRGALALDPGNAAAKKELDTLTARLKAQGKWPSMALFEAMAATAGQGQ